MKRINKEFKGRGHVYLIFNPSKSSLKSGNCAKLETRYYATFKVLDRIGLVAYRFEFPTNMRAHNTFHVSLTKICVHDIDHMINCNVIRGIVLGGAYVHP